MRKTFLKVSILGMLTVGMAAGFTSCKDYDDDIKELNTKFDALQKDLKAIQDLVSSGVVITNVSQNADGVTITMSNNQTYNITNGKDGAPGKDADVWTIVEKDGKYMWAKNGEVTEFPAQGPAGTAVAGSYYVPNAETGVFDEHKADGTVVPTTIPCFAKGSLTAVDDGNNIIISGIIGPDGKETTYTLSKTGALSSLEFIPDLYVNGIESMETDNLNGMYKAATEASKDETIDDALVFDQASYEGVPTTAVIAKGQIWKFNNANPKDYDGDISYNVLAKTDASYILNPANANLSGVTYEYITNDAEVRSRDSKAVLNINSTSAADGKLTVNYSIADLDALKDCIDYDEETGKKLQTVAALQATLKDGSVVSSNFVAVGVRDLNIWGIQYRYGADWTRCYVAPTYAETALTNGMYNHGTTNEANNAWALALPYDQISNLPDYLRIAVSEGKGPNQKFNYFSLAEIAAKYGYTMNYSILEYTLGDNSTSENMYASVSADGKFQPMYVNAAGQSVPTTTEAGRSAIGRQPVVILQLKDAEGNLILGGFVKVVLSEKATVAEPINLGDAAVGYTCNEFEVAAPWDVFTGQVVEATNMTVGEFQTLYGKPVQNHIGVVINGKIVDITTNQQSQANKTYNSTAYWNDFGTFHMDKVSGNGQTQKFYLTINQTQAKNWYPKYAKKDGEVGNCKKGDQIGVGAMTSTPVTKTIYAKFYNAGNNSILWVGYTVTLTGVPTITYDGQNPNTWIADKDIVPVSPAVANNYEGKDEQKIKAKVISVNPTSLWLTQIGQPNFKVAAPFQTANATKNNYFGNTTTKYVFAEAQPAITTHAMKQDPNDAIVYGFAPLESTPSQLWGIDITGLSEAQVENTLAKVAAGTATGAQLFAEFVGDNQIFTINAGNDVVNNVINTNAFSKTAPKTLFNVEMNVTYGNCNIDPITFGKFQVGVGRPIDVKPAANPVKFVDGSGNNTAALYNLANVVDWQGNYLWKVANNAASFTLNPHNQQYFDFWMDQNGTNPNGGYLQVGWDDVPESNASDEALNAKYWTSTDSVMNDKAQLGVRHGFTIRFNKANTNQLNMSRVSIMNADVLNQTKITYEKYGDEMSTVTSKFYVFVPVQAVYTWGKTNIGYAAIQIDPTMMPKAAAASK